MQAAFATQILRTHVPTMHYATPYFKGCTEQLLGLSRMAEVPKTRSISCVCN